MVAVGAVFPVTEATWVGSVVEELALALELELELVLVLPMLLLPTVPPAVAAPTGAEGPWDCKAAKRFCMNAVTLCAIAGSVVVDVAAAAEPGVEPVLELEAEDELVPIPACVKALTKAVAKVEAKPYVLPDACPDPSP